MKINFILPPANRSGGTRVIVIYAKKLSLLGHEVKLFSAQNKKPSLREIIKAAKNFSRPKRWLESDQSYLDDSSLDHSVVNHQGPILESDLPDADIVLATWWETAYWVFELPESKGIKAYFMQDYGAKGQEIEKIAPTWELPLKIITIHSNLEKLIFEHSGKKAVAVVRNSVDFNLFKRISRKKNTGACFGFVYRPLKSKGADIVVDAFRLAQQKRPEISLLAYGASEVSSDFPLPPQTKYYFRPDDDDLSNIYSSCDAWVFPSRIEGFGLPILESLACGTPVIATPAGAAADLISSDSGVLLESFSEIEMANAMVSIAQLTDQSWQKLSNSSFEKISDYSWDDAAHYFEQALLTINR